MVDSLSKDRWSETSTADEAEVVIVNTCGFIEPAKRESIETAFALRSRFPGKRIVLSGCLSERYGSDLSESMPEIDGFIGNHNPERINALLNSFDERAATAAAMDELTIANELADAKNGVRTKNAVNRAADSFPAAISAFTIVEGNAAYLKIAEGCDNCCSFCAIPLIRGRFRSRPVRDIVSDVQRLAGIGAGEINVIAQDIASYRTDVVGNIGVSRSSELVELLRAMLSVDGDFWLRMLYIHPDHFPDGLTDLVGEESRLLPYFDLPFQHASSSVLRGMGRKGTAERYLELLDTIRADLPDAVIRSTVLVGFPGETDADRAELLEFLDSARIDWLGVFEYSPEEGTAAFELGAPSGPARRKASRFREEIEARQLGITQTRMDRYVGRTLQVLVEEPMNGVHLAIGRGYMHAPEVDGNVVVHGEGLVEGKRYDCRIVKRNGIDLEAVVGQS